VLKPQDVVLALYLSGAGPQTQSQVGSVLGLSQSEVSYALRRLQDAQLLLQDARSVVVPHLIEFCIHGVKYAYSPVVGRRRRGIPTAALAPPLKGKVMGEESELVWPSGEGTARAASLEPLHPCAIVASQANPHLHELLALLDGIRVGKSRMRQLAEAELIKRLRARQPA